MPPLKTPKDKQEMTMDPTDDNGNCAENNETLIAEVTEHRHAIVQLITECCCTADVVTGAQLHSNNDTTSTPTTLDDNATAGDVLAALEQLQHQQKLLVCGRLENMNELRYTRDWMWSMCTPTAVISAERTQDTVISEAEQHQAVTIPEAQKEVSSRPESQQTDVLPSQPRPYAEVIEESAGTMIDCLLPCMELLQYLRSCSVLSDDMVREVLCRPNRPDKVRVLLQYLTRLGPQSVESFIRALRATEQHYLANILDRNVVI